MLYCCLRLLSPGVSLVTWGAAVRRLHRSSSGHGGHTYISGKTSVLRRIKLRCTGCGSNPGEVDIFRVYLDQPWGPPSLLYNVYRVFPGGKAAGAWCWPPIHFYRRCCECVKLYLRLPATLAYAYHGVIFKTEVDGGRHVPAAVPHMKVPYLNWGPQQKYSLRSAYFLKLTNVQRWYLHSHYTELHAVSDNKQ